MWMIIIEKHKRKLIIFNHHYQKGDLEETHTKADKIHHFNHSVQYNKVLTAG